MIVILDAQRGEALKRVGMQAAVAKSRFGPAPKNILQVGQVVGHLVVVGEAVRDRGSRKYPVRCVCGSERLMRVDWLFGGRVKSCGCRKAELSAAKLRTHGMSGTPEYEAWCDMRSRCADPKDNQYQNYGARGIRVCDEWSSSFAAFIAYVGRRPGLGYSLDRIDNDGHYEPGNVRWASDKEQVRNRRVTLFITFRGQRRALADHCEAQGLPYDIVYQRIFRYGVDIERALTAPVGPRGFQSKAGAR